MSSTVNPNVTEPMESSGDWGDAIEIQRAETLNIVTYVGSAISIIGVLLTLLSYIGYRKFHIKRPHIIIVNMCICLLIYYFAYIISNNHRQQGYIDPDHSLDHAICLFGAIVCQFAILATWFWITVYWLILLVMYQRPMGGHVSHFFIKSAAPAYGLPLMITVITGIVAHLNGAIQRSHDHETHGLGDGYYGSQCFVANGYLHIGLILPFCLLFIPIVAVFILVARGIFTDTERSKTSSSQRNIKMHFVRLTIITVLFAIVAFSSLFVPSLKHYDLGSFASVIVFSIVSSLLGISLMILFCVNQQEIRSHWLSVLRGERPTLRHHSMRKSFDTNLSSNRKTSTLMGNHPSVYIENYDDERKSSTYRIVAKEDTDMSTLGLIQIPGTPSPNRLQDVKAEKGSGESSKLRGKKSDRGSRDHDDDDSRSFTPKDKAEGFEEFKGKNDTKSRRKAKQSRSTSTPPVSPRKKSVKKQQSSEDVLKSPNSRNGGTHNSERKKPKRSNSASRIVARFTRKSTSGVEDTAQLTEL